MRNFKEYGVRSLEENAKDHWLGISGYRSCSSPRILKLLATATGMADMSILKEVEGVGVAEIVMSLISLLVTLSSGTDW